VLLQVVIVTDRFNTHHKHTTDMDVLLHLVFEPVFRLSKRQQPELRQIHAMLVDAVDKVPSEQQTPPHVQRKFANRYVSLLLVLKKFGKTVNLTDSHATNRDIHFVAHL